MIVAASFRPGLALSCWPAAAAAASDQSAECEHPATRRAAGRALESADPDREFLRQDRALLDVQGGVARLRCCRCRYFAESRNRHSRRKRRHRRNHVDAERRCSRRHFCQRRQAAERRAVRTQGHDRHSRSRTRTSSSSTRAGCRRCRAFRISIGEARARAEATEIKSRAPLVSPQPSALSPIISAHARKTHAMTNYKAPLADMRFVMFDLLKVEAQYHAPAGRRERDARRRRRDPRRGGEVLRTGARAAQRQRRRGRLPPRQGDARR